MRKGFSLVEMLVTMVILTFVITATSMIMLSMFKSFSVAADVSSVQNDAVTLNEVYKDRIYYATGIEILPSVPTVGEDDKYYIYSDPDTNSVMYRMENDIPEKLYSGITASQQVLFSKIDDRTIASVFTVEEGDSSYNLDSDVSLQNGVGGDGITEDPSIVGMSGSCIAFTFKYIGTGDIVLAPLILDSYVFEKANNTDTQMAFEEDLPAKIDQAKRTVTVNFPFREPTDHTVQSLWPKATVDVSLSTDFLTLDKLAGDTKYYRSSLDSTRIKDYPAVSYINPKKVFIQSNDGRSKMYTVNATYKAETVIASDLSIVPTKHDIASTDDTNKVIRENVYMPTDESTLHAVFQVKDQTKIQEENFYFEWYAVDTEEEVKGFNEKTYENYEDYKVYSVANDRRLKITEENREDIVGKYVFYRVAAIVDGSVDETFVSSIDGDITLTENIDDRTPYVYITLDYGKMWETTLNEIDFDYGGTFQQESSRNSYLKSPTFQTFYETEPGTDMEWNGVELRLYNFSDYKFNTINQDHRAVPRAGFDPYDKYEKVGGLYYAVDLVNKDLNIKGKRGINYNLPTWVSGDKYLTMCRPGILSIPQYDDFYTDRRPADYNKYYNGYNTDSGIRVGIKHDKPSESLGGFGISPNTKVTYLNSGLIYNYPKGGGNGGYYYDFVYQRGPNEEPGIKAVELSDNGYLNAADADESSGKNILVNNIARNPNPSRNIGGVTPYLFSSISNDDFTIDPTKPQDLIIDVHYTKARPTSNTPSTDWFDVQSLVTLNVSDKDGNYANPAYFGAFYPNMYYMENYEEGNYPSGGTDKGLYNLSATEQIRGSDINESHSGSYKGDDIDILENRHFVFTAWSYVNNPNGNVASQVTDEMDLTITEFTKLEEREPNEPPPPIYIDTDRNRKYKKDVDVEVPMSALNNTYRATANGDLIFTKSVDGSEYFQKVDIKTKNYNYDMIFQSGAKIKCTSSIVMNDARNIIIEDNVSLTAGTNGYINLEPRGEKIEIGKNCNLTGGYYVDFRPYNTASVTIGDNTILQSKQRQIRISESSLIAVSSIEIGDNVQFKSAYNTIMKTSGPLTFGKNCNITQSNTGKYKIELVCNNLKIGNGTSITAAGSGLDPGVTTTTNNPRSIHITGPNLVRPAITLDGVTMKTTGTGKLTMEASSFNVTNSSSISAASHVDINVAGESNVSDSIIYSEGGYTGLSGNIITIDNSEIAAYNGSGRNLRLGNNIGSTSKIYIKPGSRLRSSHGVVELSAKDKVAITGATGNITNVWGKYGSRVTTNALNPNIICIGYASDGEAKNIEINKNGQYNYIQVSTGGYTAPEIEQIKNVVFDTINGIDIDKTSATQANVDGLYIEYKFQ